MVGHLIGARCLLQSGWTKGKYEREDPFGTKYCLVGALRAASAPPQAYRELVITLGKTPSRWLSRDAFRLVWFNDRAKRRHEDILDLIDRTLVRLWAMDIGKEEPARVVTPEEEPVPSKMPIPEPKPEPAPVSPLPEHVPA